MLDQEKRTAILVLHGQDLSVRAIARACRASRSSVRAVIKSASAEVPRPERKEQAEPWRDEILSLYKDCKGNLARVHEKLVDQGAHVTYQALTGFCRRNEIGSKAAVPAGHYTFAAGQEMQNDTSPHRVKIAGKVRLAQCACLVLAHSRMCFMAYYPTFDRFWCKTFLTEAFRYFGGTCKECMIDNTHVVVAHGSGQTMVPVPEMEAFATRFGFRFRAHAIGHANRSAHVERKFRHIEQNFLAGREFQDWDDLNRQAREWCDQVNAKAKRDLHARPIDLFVQEKITLNPLPAYVPEVYRLHHRVVDVEGYVRIQRNAYSVPYKLIGRQLEVRESHHRIDVYDGPRQVASHARSWDGVDQRVTVKEHRPPRGEGRSKAGPFPEEKELLREEPGLADFVAGLKAHFPWKVTRVLKRLHGLVRDYPRAPLLGAAIEAMAYGMFDLERLEGMILRRVRHDHFGLEDSHE
jgi:transposase